MPSFDIAKVNRRTVEEIVEAEAGSRETTAVWIHGVQCDAANLAEVLADDPRVPSSFVESLREVADAEIRL